MFNISYMSCDCLHVGNTGQPRGKYCKNFRILCKPFIKLAYINVLIERYENIVNQSLNQTLELLIH